MTSPQRANSNRDDTTFIVCGWRKVSHEVSDLVTAVRGRRLDHADHAPWSHIPCRAAAAQRANELERGKV